jgi:hypothetical protein
MFTNSGNFPIWVGDSICEKYNLVDKEKMKMYKKFAMVHKRNQFVFASLLLTLLILFLLGLFVNQWLILCASNMEYQGIDLPATTKYLLDNLLRNRDFVSVELFLTLWWFFVLWLLYSLAKYEDCEKIINSYFTGYVVLWMFIVGFLIFMAISLTMPYICMCSSLYEDEPGLLECSTHFSFKWVPVFVLLYGLFCWGKQKILKQKLTQETE